MHWVSLIKVPNIPRDSIFFCSDIGVKTIVILQINSMSKYFLYFRYSYKEKMSDIQSKKATDVENIISNDYVETSLNEVLKSDETPFSREQNRFLLRIPNIVGRSEYKRQRVLELLTTPSGIEFANFIIKYNEGGKVCINGTTYILLSVAYQNASSDSYSDEIVLKLKFKVYTKKGEESEYMRATTSISKLVVDDNFFGENSNDLAVLAEIKNVEKVLRIVVYYALLSISTVCENMELMEKVLLKSAEKASIGDNIYAFVPFNLLEDMEYKEDISTSIVDVVNEAIEHETKLLDCKQELLCIGVVPASVNTLSKYFSRDEKNFISPSDIKLVSSRPTNFTIYLNQGNTVISRLVYQFYINLI